MGLGCGGGNAGIPAMESDGAIAVDGGVEGGVVVHLQLAVKLELARPIERVLPKCVEAGSEIGALDLENGETLAIAVGVAGGSGFGCGGAVDLFAGVKDLERQDGEAVDHEARGFGVERSLGVGQSARSEFGKESAVELFSQVVAALIGGVDAPFDVGEHGIGCAGGAGFILDVPELIVGAMLAGDE
jgi:hypothetical protein